MAKSASTSVVVGVDFVVNGNPVSLSSKPKEAADKGKSWKQTGLHFELSNKIDVGSEGELKTFLANHLGEDVKTEIMNLPEPLNTIETQFADCHLMINKFDFSLPALKDEKNKDIENRDPITFALGLSAEWADVTSENPSNFAVKKLSLEINRTVIEE